MLSLSSQRKGCAGQGSASVSTRCSFNLFTSGHLTIALHLTAPHLTAQHLTARAIYCSAKAVQGGCGPGSAFASTRAHASRGCCAPSKPPRSYECLWRSWCCRYVVMVSQKCDNSVTAVWHLVCRCLFTSWCCRCVYNGTAATM